MARVWFFTTYSVWTDNAYAVRVRGEMDALHAAGASLGLIRTYSAKSPGRPRRQDAEQFMGRGIPVIDRLQPPDFGNSLLRRIQDAWLRRRLRAAAQRAEIAILHAHGTRAGSLCSTVDRRTRVIVDVHGDIVAEAALQTGPRVRTRVRWAHADTDAAMERADGLVAVSPPMVSHLAKLTAGRKVPSVIVPSAVDDARFPDCPVPKAGGNRGELIVIYAGGLQAYQPADLVAQACRDLRDATSQPLQFWVLTPDQHDAVRAAFASRDLAVSVMSVPAQRVASILAQADLGLVPRFAHPTNTVASPTKIAEYLAAGVPVACSPHVGGWAEWLAARGVGTELAVGNASSLDAFLRHIMRDREAMRSTSQAVARAELTWRGLTPRLADLYKEVCRED